MPSAHTKTRKNKKRTTTSTRTRATSRRMSATRSSHATRRSSHLPSKRVSRAFSLFGGRNQRRRLSWHVTDSAGNVLSSGSGVVPIASHSDLVGPALRSVMKRHPTLKSKIFIVIGDKNGEHAVYSTIAGGKARIRRVSGGHH